MGFAMIRKIAGPRRRNRRHTSMSLQALRFEVFAYDAQLIVRPTFWPIAWWLTSKPSTRSSALPTCFPTSSGYSASQTTLFRGIHCPGYAYLGMCSPAPT